MDISSNNFENPFSAIILEDRDEKIIEDFESVWNGYLNVVNLFQFKENSLFMTTKGIENNLYNEFFVQEDVADDINIVAGTNEFWKENIDYIDESFKKLIDVLLENNIDNPDEIGYELINEDEEVIALCEIAWIDKKVAILTDEQQEFKQIFDSKGWNSYIVTRDDTIFEQILDRLK